MIGLYIGSTAGYSGKNLFAVALGLALQRENRQLGYMKPVGAAPQDENGSGGDKDADFVQKAFGLSQDPALVTPVVVTREFLIRAFTADCPAKLDSVTSAYQSLSQGKDVMIVGGSGSFLHSGAYCGLAGVDVAKALECKTVIIDRFSDGFHYDYLLHAKETMGDELAGVVLNDAPPQALEEAREFIAPYLESKGVDVLGIVPRDSFIGGIRIGEMAERLGATVISAEGKRDTVVENVLIGTMQVENFMIHFQRSANSAILVGGDRSDIQLVALEGNCPCLILTGNLYPNGFILARSEKLDIPIIVAKQDTYTVAKRIGEILGSQKFRDQIKINRASQLIKSSLDLERLKTKTGLD